MPQYLLSVHGVQGTPPPDQKEMAVTYDAVGDFNAELQSAGAWVFAGGLLPPSSASVVRAAAQGDVLITDGPFAEGKEHIGGVWVIDAPDRDAALAWAAKATVACRLPVEVRPFQEIPPAAAGR